MEKKLIAVVFIGLLGGLGGGYGLGYAIYQPQILGLQSDLSNFKSASAGAYNDLIGKYNALNSSYSELMNVILLHKSPIEITFVNATLGSLNYTVRNNGEQMEYLIPHLIFKDTNGSYLGQVRSSSFSKTMFPHEEFTIHTENLTGLESFIIEVWTYDGDSASAYVEILK